MKKTLILLMLVFLVGLVTVSAEQVDIGQEVIDYIIDNYKDIAFTPDSVILYCNPSILNCEEFKRVINDLNYGNIFMTNGYFTQLSAGSLAICLNDYSTRRNIKSGEVKNYADYCKNFQAPSEGILSILPKVEERRFMKYVKLPESSLNEDIVYVTPVKGHHPGFGIYFDYNNPKIHAMSPEEQVNLMDKAEKFVHNRTWESFYKNIRELEIEDDKLYEEKSSLTTLSTPEAVARLAEISERRTEIERSMQTLRSLYEKAYDEGDIELLKDYSLPYEGEVIDGFTLKKGWVPQPEYSFPEKLSEFFELQGPYEGVIVENLEKVYVFIEEPSQVKPETLTEEKLTEEPKVEEPVVEEKPVTEEQPVVEEQPVTGLKRITNSLKELFFGKSVEEETSQEKQPPEQPEQPKKEEEKLSNKILCKLLHPFSKERYASCLAG